MASIASRPSPCPVMDPNLFTFKPKLNEKSNEITQNMLNNFYERQKQHTQRVQDLVSLSRARRPESPSTADLLERPRR